MTDQNSVERVDTVATVRGPVAADELGVTLTHEHLFVLSAEIQANYPHLWDADAGVDSAVEQLEQAYDAGVRTILDMTVIGQGRDISLVRRVAERVRVNIAVATGVYSVDGTPLWARFRGPGGVLIQGEDPFVDLLVRDIETGIGDSGVRASVVKFAVEENTPEADTDRMVALMAEVHRRTGVNVVVHSDPGAANGMEVLRKLADNGVPPERVEIGHAGDSPDLGYLRALADSGCYLGYDRYGMTPFAPDEQRNETLATLVREGHLGQLLVSQDHPTHIDYFTPEQVKELMPDWTYTTFFDRALPHLLTQDGVDEEVVRTILVDNGRRLLTGQPALAKKEVQRVGG